MDPPTYPFEETSFMNGPYLIWMPFKTFLLFVEHIFVKMLND